MVEVEPIGRGSLEVLADQTRRVERLIVVERVVLLTASGLLTGGILAAFVFTRSIPVLILAILWPLIFPLFTCIGLAAMERLAPLLNQGVLSTVQSYLGSAPKVGDEVMVLSQVGRKEGWRGTIIGKHSRGYLVSFASGRLRIIQRNTIWRLDDIDSVFEARNDVSNADAISSLSSAGE